MSAVVLKPIKSSVNLEWIALVATAMIWIAVISLGAWVAITYMDLMVQLEIQTVLVDNPTPTPTPTVPPSRIVIPSMNMDASLEPVSWERGETAEIWQLSGGTQSEELVVLMYWEADE